MASSSRTSCWNDELTKKLLDALIAYQLEFGPEEPIRWVWIACEFKNATGKQCRPETLKNKHRQMKLYWRLWKHIKDGETKLSWDAENGCVDAPHEWWDKKIGENVHFKQFRRKGISPELEELLDEVYERTTDALLVVDELDYNDDTSVGSKVIQDILEQMICDNQEGR